jgi:hypothetical protein
MSLETATYSRVFPTIQGATSKTFSAPPLNTQITFPELFAYHASHSASHEMFVYAEGGRIKSITYAQAFRAQLKVARIVKSAYEMDAKSASDAPNFAILANAGKTFYNNFSMFGY